MARKQKSAFYAVARGRRVGIFGSWPECEMQVKGAAGAIYKSFKTRDEAVKYMRLHRHDFEIQPVNGETQSVHTSNEEAKERESPTIASDSKVEVAPWWERRTPEPAEEIEIISKSSLGSSKRGAEPSQPGSIPQKKKTKVNVVEVEAAISLSTELVVDKTKEGRIIEVYTDGASSDNGKPNAKAGWGVYWPESKDPTSDLFELNESQRLPGQIQTNNRAELMGIIRAIQLCPDPKAQLIIYTDSQYSIKAINEWQRNWRKNNWLTSSNGQVANKDLIRLLERELRSRSLRPTLVYVKGHSSNVGNCEADKLAVQGAKLPMIPQSQWTDIEPSDSEEETSEYLHQKAIQMWQKAGFTKEQAKARAGGQSSS